MGKKSGQKGRKKDRRKAAPQAEAQAAGHVDPGSGRVIERGLASVAVEPPGQQAIREAMPERVGERANAAELAARLAGLSTVLQRHLARVDAGDGLTRARLSALALLVLGGPRTLGQLATAEGVRPPTMTRLVRAMEADSLVIRERHPSDGRSIIISATAAGEARLAEGRARQIAPLAGTISGLGEAERAQLEDAADLLGRVLREVTWEPLDTPA